MPIKEEDNKKEALKQWDTIVIGIAPVRLSYWGFNPDQMPLLLQWSQLQGLTLHPAEKNLLSFNDFNLLVTQLHKKGFDTSRLNEAVAQAVKMLAVEGPSVVIGDKNEISLEDFKKTVEKVYADTPVNKLDDLQKNRWGGRSSDNGLHLKATVIKSAIPGFYSIDATVHSTVSTGKPLAGYVAFFLHDTFINEIEYILVENDVATLKLPLCYEAFTLAAYTEDGTTLELDLNEVSGYPKGFYWEDLSIFQDRVKEIYEQKPVTVKDDLQKERWGGKNNIKDKILSADVAASGIPGLFNVHLKVSFNEPKSGAGEVAFFLHESFGRQIRFVPIKDGLAELKIKAYEAFTVGAYTEDGTELELDLQTEQGYPQDFYYLKNVRVGDDPILFKNKWVLVAGTGTEKLSYEENIMSETLGQLLAKEGFGLVCGGWFGVDKVVSETFANFLRTKQIPYKDRLIQLVEAGQNSGYEIGELRVLDKGENWYQEALKQTCALVMIGGKGGTYHAYERARKIGKPVLPIPQTGGDALTAYDKIAGSSDLLIPPDQLKKLNQPIKSIDDPKIISNAILSILNQVTKENHYASPDDFKAKVKELYGSRPVVTEKDPQKNRWGGTPVRDGKRLMASVKKSSKWYYDITIDLISEAGPPLYGEVAFFLHPSFKDPIRFTRSSDSRAQISVRASNAFVIGAYTEDETMLELDLQTVEGYPQDFYYKENGTGEFQFYTEEEICGLVGSQITIASDFITGCLLIFQTRKQKTWLVATSKSLFVMLDDEETRKDKEPVMTFFKKNKALPLSFRSSQKLASSSLVMFSAEERWWYYTIELFPKPKMLTESVQKLVEKSSLEPLSSLYFQLTIESADSTLKSNTRQGQEDERENEMSTQGGVPRTPYEVENFTSLLTPIVEYLGNLNDDFITRAGSETSQGFVVLIALDNVHNCILSFGEIGGIEWCSKSNKRNLSAGFLTHSFFSRSSELSCPSADGIIRKKGLSRYSISWDLDPVTFKDSIDRKNKNINPTIPLPETLEMIVLSFTKQLPFLENDFSQTNAVNLWTSTNSNNILKKSSKFEATLSISVNEKAGSAYFYKLNKVVFEELYDEYGKTFDLRCTKFLFQRR